MYGARSCYSFDGGVHGPWQVLRMSAPRGDPLPWVDRLSIHAGDGAGVPDPVWRLRGVTSHLRYTLRSEAGELAERGNPLGRTGRLKAALIPIRKNAQWWALAQDERRAIYEERSRHTSIGMEYLPEIARRLHHGRDLGEDFDFLTWFEFRPENEGRFDELLGRLREREEWLYVEREIDVRLEMASEGA